ncbi:aldo/keto reductase [bacterium]|nr:aldo/keto reductase [bacterium]
MRIKVFGRSGLRVSELCLGTMTFGEDWGWGASKEECRKIFEEYVERGGNFIDTANAYTNGSSEKIVGELVKSDRERYVIATKYTLVQRDGDPNAAGNQRKSLVAALDASLKRLGLDYIDLYWVHAWDSVTPTEEVMRALDDQVRAGKILYVGISDAPAWIVSRANTIADFRGWTPFAGLQIEYSLIQRAPERELLPMANAMDLAVCAWGPIGGGLLSGKYDDAKLDDGSKRQKINDFRVTPRNLSIAREAKAVAEELGVLPVQVAMNWVRQKPGVMLPIIGPRTAEQMRGVLGYLDFTLSDEHMRRLDEASRIELGFPHDFLASDRVRGIIHANRYDDLDRHRPSS